MNRQTVQVPPQRRARDDGHAKPGRNGFQQSRQRVDLGGHAGLEPGPGAGFVDQATQEMNRARERERRLPQGGQGDDRPASLAELQACRRDGDQFLDEQLAAVDPGHRRRRVGERQIDPPGHDEFAERADEIVVQAQPDRRMCCQHAAEHWQREGRGRAKRREP
jgi:hypothetical protein